MDGWTWPMLRVKPTENARYRVWLGQCALHPLPSAPDKPLEGRLYLKQWGPEAQEPYSFCLEIIKFIAMPGKTPTAYKGLQHFQISEHDWNAWFGGWCWWSEVRDRIEEFKTAAPPIPMAFELRETA